MKESIVIFWFRRDLRLEDNHGLHQALQSGKKVLPLFIFDENILTELPSDDRRVSLIYTLLKQLHAQLNTLESSLYVLKGTPQKVFRELTEIYEVEAVYTNTDYEPYAIRRDRKIAQLLKEKNSAFHSYKDQVIFEKEEILKSDGTPYTVYTPYQKKWVDSLQTIPIKVSDSLFQHFIKQKFAFPTLTAIGFEEVENNEIVYKLPQNDYETGRDFPTQEVTSQLSIPFRFGTVSIRKIAQFAIANHFPFLRQLIWREFYMQILYHFPQVVTQNFKPQYDEVVWRNQPEEFQKWCKGMTGYPLVDAGMRQLNQTGKMHNRVRMVCASFLCKHLLIDWRWGEAYFARKLLDYDLALNNGNWQWVAGTGCDAAPYFRIFNPHTQLKKFDPNAEYIRKWIQDFDTLHYPQPMVEHKYARERFLKAFNIVKNQKTK